MIGASESFMLLNLNLGAVGDTRLLRCNILIFRAPFSPKKPFRRLKFPRQVAMHFHATIPTM
jgi:hypothetical protein